MGETLTGLPDGVLQKDGKPQIFYHGTSVPDFTEFDPKKIGTAHDMGWYGKGFYFCFTKGEAEYYGPYVREACLAIKNPFYFTEELLEIEGQNTCVIGDMAALAINLSKKFPKFAKRLTVTTVDSFGDFGVGIGVRETSLFDYANIVLQVFNDPELDIFECWHGDICKYHYRVGDDYNALHQAFSSVEQAKKNRLDAATIYVNNHVFAHVDTHIPEYFIEDIAEEFSLELQSIGYDGVLQSASGDEAVCFSPSQIFLVDKGKD